MPDGSAPIRIRGRWLSPMGSGAVEADLLAGSPAAREITIAPRRGEPFNATISEVSDRVGSIERRIEMMDGGAFVTRDNDAVDGLDVARGGLFAGNRVGALEAIRPRLIGIVALAILLVVGIVRYGIPVAANVAATVTPSSVVRAMDGSSLETLDRIYFSDSRLSESARAPFEADFARLLERAGWREGEGGPRYQLLFRDGGFIGANALALPGGTIILTDQLVKLISREEVAAVLAHEIGHVEGNHSLQHIYRAAGWAGLAALIVGDASAVLDSIVGGGGVLLAMRASREMEMDADARAVRLMSRTREDPRALITALDRLRADYCGDITAVSDTCLDDTERTGWLDSHPGGAERREALEAAIEAADTN